MKFVHKLYYVWAVILILAGLTWGIIAVFDKNIVLEIFDNDIADVVYVVFGVAAIFMIIDLFDR